MPRGPTPCGSSLSRQCCRRNEPEENTAPPDGPSGLPEHSSAGKKDLRRGIRTRRFRPTLFRAASNPEPEQFETIGHLATDQLEKQHPWPLVGENGSRLSQGRGVVHQTCAVLTATALVAAFSIPQSAAAQTCIDVERITLEGVSVLDRAVLEAALATQIGCLGIAELNGLLETVTLVYADAGYVAARGYLPEQDVSDGELTIAVIEGELVGIDLRENGLPAPLRAVTAFPGMVGRPLELGRLEQGLAQINRLPSSEATSELRPGAGAGETVLAVDVQQVDPWSASLTLDDRGTETTGRYNFGLNLSADDLVGLNDQFVLSYQRSTEPSPLAFGTDSPVGHSLSLSGSFPYGFWTFGAALSASGYVTHISGITGPIESTGTSASIRLSADRVLSVSEGERWDVGASLTVKENENQILGATIDTASRRLSILDLWISRNQVVWDGQAQVRFTLRHGLGAFGALDDDTTPAGSPSAQYRAALLDLSLGRQWDLFGQPVVLTASLNAFYSDDALFGSEQIPIGGFSSVRGTRTSVLFGNRGAQFVTNLRLPSLLEGTSAEISLTPYLGVDAGYVAPQESLGIAEGHLISWTLGSTFAHQDLRIDATWSAVLGANDGVAFPDNGIFSIQASFVF